ncbi:hypothetical protein Gpo141_00002289 [Globisporangium polare]
MLRRRSAAYEASSLYGSKSTEAEAPSKQDAKDAFLDLRIDMSNRAPSAACLRTQLTATSITTNVSKSAVRSPSVKAAYMEKAKAATATAASSSQPGALAPSNLHSALRRCQSASTIRKKLQNAVEQSSAQMTHEQLAVLRSLAASVAAKPTQKSLRSRQLASDGVSTAYSSNNAVVSGSGGIYRPSSAATSLQQQLPPHYPQKNRSQDPFTASTPPSKTRNPDSVMCAGQQRSKTVGGFKSSTVQLEVELVERLNEIERSKLNEKAVSRFRACQKTLDAVIQQDEQFGRVLSKIRDEVALYVDTLSRSTGSSSQGLANRGSHCECGKPKAQSSNQSSSDLDFDNALFRQENVSLKKNCVALQKEIQVLQRSLMFATIAQTSDKPSASPGSPAFSPESDDQEFDGEDDLSEIQLLPDSECRQSLRRPPNIPQLNFAALSPYCEEADEDDEDLDDEF